MSLNKLVIVVSVVDGGGVGVVVVTGVVVEVGVSVLVIVISFPVNGIVLDTLCEYVESLTIFPIYKTSI